jgi:hypothetical protein
MVAVLPANRHPASPARYSPARTALTVAVVILAVLGAFAVVGWVISAVLLLVRLAVLVAVVAVAFAVVRRVAIGGRSRRH